MQSSNLFVVQLWILFQQTTHFRATFYDMQLARYEFLSEERIFWYWVYESAKRFRKLSIIPFWIDLCPGGDIQRQKDNKLDRETCPNIGIYLLKSCEGTSLPLQLWSSSPRCILKWFSRRSGFTEHNQNEIVVSGLWDNNKDWTVQHLGETHNTC